MMLFPIPRTIYHIPYTTHIRQMRKVQRHRSAGETVELTTVVVVLQKTNNQLRYKVITISYSVFIFP